MTHTLNDKVEAIAAEFEELEPRERLELLLEFAEKLPPLPQALEQQRDQGAGRVHECQTPVFLWADVENGRVRVFAEVAPEAPTVKGFVSLLAEIFSGAAPDEVLAFQPNLVARFGLADALGMVRMRGLTAIAHHIRQKVASAIAG
jgi:cysteine desulfuration protein SufE